MAIRDNTQLSVMKTSIGLMIDQPNAIGDQFDEADVETFIRNALYEMAIHAPMTAKFLSGYDGSTALTVTSSLANLPSDYLFHDTKEPLTCEVSTAGYRIYYSEDEEDYRINNSANDTFFYRIINNKIQVSDATIDKIYFPYIKTPTMLAEVAISPKEFRLDLYDAIPNFVIGKLYQYELASKEQKARALPHMIQFYKLIGAADPEKLAKQQVA